LNKDIVINYVCEVEYPNTSAYAIHVLKMCDAFASQNNKINLISPHISLNINKLKVNYNIKNKINFFSILKTRRTNFLKRIFFSLKILNNKSVNKGICIYISRSVIFAIIGSIFNKKVILELHHELSGLTKILYFFLKKRQLLKNLRYIFIHKNLIRAFKPTKKKYICLDDAVDVHDFKNDKFSKKIEKTCVYVGSFHRGKGVELILQIAKTLQHVNFHLYGDRNFLNSEKKLKNVKIFNYINYKKIPKILSKYEIALMPYGNWVSGRLKKINLRNSMSPLKMFDYLASGNIIIASDLDVYKHILKNNYNSILLNNSQTNLWCHWIDKIFTSTKKYTYIKKNSLKTAKKHTWLIRSKKILNFAHQEFF
jgi:glycosyltransferase involved in cell wall biosynthesis|tara:strand:- start:273 stop:1376 length:1104 start_codon:yes stop_codon:yes gene_type:complete